ncbi:hypothetical protein Cylst_2577 [Cylindrospermum stagnale PCC 7417]|uniref:Uncharacterized protein n=1 Tax=Cylindrospermum stagnale PCC 7417 TaxID=56107 RepID=K9WX45_9NOST|nr:hypothetical protein [Cylindrospermum stagnale]AFZ24783.1 hypothetical protein Cylst_2577 [Cylindrospermum stagnale PCC 7417]
MAERTLTEILPGATQDVTKLEIPKTSLVEATATNKFTPAATNTLESMIAGLSQILAVKFPTREYGDDTTRNLQVTVGDPTVSTSGGVTYTETVFTYTFQRVLSADELSSIALKPDGM